MKKTALLSVFAALLVSLLVGCGEEIRYMSTPENLDGKIEILDANTQKMTLYTNSDGTLRGIISGSIKIHPNDVKNLFFASDRVGYGENSIAKASLQKNNSATFNNLPNNDSGQYFIQLQDGRIFQIDVNKWNFSAATYKEMLFELENGIVYSQDSRHTLFDTSMTLTPDANGTTATLEIDLGCDRWIGLKEVIEFAEGQWIVFVEANGTSHSTNPWKDIYGNIRATIGGIPISMDVNTEGKMYLVQSDGKRIEFEFNWRNWSDRYVWYMSSDIPNVELYSNYDEETGNIVIRYYRYNSAN